MDRISASVIASIVLTAPVWVRVGLTVRDERTQARAADALVATIIEQIDSEPSVDNRQIALDL